MKNFIRLSSFLFVILFFACDNVDPFDIDDVDFGDPEIGVPLVNSTFYIADIGVDPDNNTEVISDNEGRVTLRYTDQLNPIPITDVFPSVIDKDLVVLSNPQDFSLPFNDVDIRKGVFKNSSLSFEIINPTNEALDVRVSISGITDPSTGAIFSKTYNLTGNQTLLSPKEDLSGLSVNAPLGVLELTYTASTATNSSVSINDFRVSFNRLDFSYLEGVFENVLLPSTEDLVDIAFFDSWVSGGLSISDPKLKFDVKNSIGVPAEIKLNYANITTVGGGSFELESDLLNEGISFDYPSLSEVGESKTTTVEINSDNSNIIDLFDKKPTAIDYDVDLQISSSQNGDIGFYTDTSHININAVVELPLFLRANDLILQNTFDFEEIEYDQIDGTAELKISLINAFPIGVGINLDFLDVDGAILFTLMEDSDWISMAANKDVTLGVEDLEAQILSIPIAEEDVLKIPKVSKVLAKVLITTTEGFDDDYVWVHDHHGVDIKLGAVLR